MICYERYKNIKTRCIILTRGPPHWSRKQWTITCSRLRSTRLTGNCDVKSKNWVFVGEVDFGAVDLADVMDYEDGFWLDADAHEEGNELWEKMLVLEQKNCKKQTNNNPKYIITE